MIVAQFSRPPEELTQSLFTPLVIAGALYVILFLAARFVAGRGDARAGELLDDLGFGLVLVTGLYAIGLALYSISERSELMWDMLKIMLVVFVFFALLLVFMLLWELLLSRGARSRTRPSADRSG